MSTASRGKLNNVGAMSSLSSPVSGNGVSASEDRNWEAALAAGIHPGDRLSTHKPDLRVDSGFGGDVFFFQR